MRKVIMAVIVFIVVTGCSSRTNSNPTTCAQALAKADQLLQLAEQSLQISARQIIAVSRQDATAMAGFNSQLNEISKQADQVGPEYKQLKDECMGTKD